MRVTFLSGHQFGEEKFFGDKDDFFLGMVCECGEYDRLILNQAPDIRVYDWNRGWFSF